MLFTLLLALFCQEKAPDLTELSFRARKTHDKVLSGHVAWTAVHEIAGEEPVAVKVIRTKDHRKRIVEVRTDAGTREEVATILERDGFWYAFDKTITGKFRPYEAPLADPTVYLILDRSDLRLLTNPLMLSGSTFESGKDGIGRWRRPLDADSREKLKKFSKDLEHAMRVLPQGERRKRVTEKLVEIRESLDKGILIKVDLDSGVVLEIGSPRFRTRIEGFLFPRFSDTDFTVDGKTWDDYTWDPTKRGSPEDYILINHCLSWDPADEELPEPSGSLLNIKTGHLRRLPFENGTASGGCFSKDRKRVYVEGTQDDGMMRIVEIDLSTGQNRVLAENLPAKGEVRFPMLSPDGTMLAAVHVDASDRVLNSRLTLIDLETRQGRHIGDPMDGGYLSWLPDGKSLVFMERVRKSADPRVEPDRRIVRCDLEGKTTILRLGSGPVVSPDGRTLLFQDVDGLWKMVDINGGESKLLGNGYRDHESATFSPDGTRLILMSFPKNDSPAPILVDVKTGKSRRIPIPPGLLGRPVWR